MNNLEVRIGDFIQIGNMRFREVEGGFGENKKCILASDIAKIHNKDNRTVNQTINRNIKRFKNGVDLLNLLNITESDVENKVEFVKENYDLDISPNTKSVYILSERGYSKLLKIMEDDLAWERYDKLVDEYFTMREIIKTKELTEEEKLALLVFHGGEKGLIASKKLAEIETNRKTKELRDGNNKVISATIVVRMLKIEDLTTTYLHEWFSENGFGEMKLEKSGKKRYFAPNEKFFDYVAKEGYSYTGETVKRDKIKAIYSINLVDMLLDNHMKSLVEFVELKKNLEI